MSTGSGVKGLKLTSGVCCLLLLSMIDFPAGSTFLNRATLRLDDPGPRALDSRLWWRRKHSRHSVRRQGKKYQPSNRAIFLVHIAFGTLEPAL